MIDKRSVSSTQDEQWGYHTRAFSNIYPCTHTHHPNKFPHELYIKHLKFSDAPHERTLHRMILYCQNKSHEPLHDRSQACMASVKYLQTRNPTDYRKKLQRCY